MSAKGGLPAGRAPGAANAHKIDPSLFRVRRPRTTCSGTNLSAGGPPNLKFRSAEIFQGQFIRQWKGVKWHGSLESEVEVEAEKPRNGRTDSLGSQLGGEIFVVFLQSLSVGCVVVSDHDRVVVDSDIAI